MINLYEFICWYKFDIINAIVKYFAFYKPKLLVVILIRGLVFSKRLPNKCVKVISEM